jgi:hypothetical protein
MYTQQEEITILQGIGDVINEMEHVPVQDFASFLVKYNPKLAEELVNEISFTFFDNYITENEKMQENQSLMFNATEEQDVPAWKYIDDALRAMTVLRQHEESMTEYQRMKENMQ